VRRRLSTGDAAPAASRTARGREAERRVAELLTDRGYVVLGTNVRVGRDELDVVALDGATLVVVEVRSRRPGAVEHPFESITRAKATRLRRAAERYLVEHGAQELRLDVAAVVGDAIDVLENAIDFTIT
jgi:putative endonuclease